MARNTQLEHDPGEMSEVQPCAMAGRGAWNHGRRTCLHHAMRLNPYLSLVLFPALSLVLPPFNGHAQPKSQSPTPVPADAANQGADAADYAKFNQILSFIRARNAQQYAIDPGKGIDEESYVPIGGIEQWVTIRGQDRRNPVLLFVHGGPGDVTNLWSFALFAPWEDHFTVVQWDQRGAGRTFKKSGPSVASTITVDRMAQDGIELTRYLCKRLDQKKIILVAHSMGTIIGLRMVQSSPDLFYAYVGTGEVADETRGYSVAYDALLKKAKNLGNEQAVAELKSVGPPPYKSGQGYQVQRKWSNRFEGADEFLNGTIGLTLVAPGGSVEDFTDDAEGQMLSAQRLVPQTTSATMKDLGLDFKLPMFFFEGTEDFTTPTALARQYFVAIRAPRKEYVPIPGGHFAVFINSGQFLKELIAHMRPLALNN
jgi:pimeloyl-ACP methyl ester carboxylesterase